MMLSGVTAGALLAASVQADAYPLMRATFEQDPTEYGWRIVARDGAATGAEWRKRSLFTTGPMWQSPRCPVEALVHYRVRFRVRTNGPALWAAVFVDRAGTEMAADFYNGIDDNGGGSVDACFQAHVDAVAVSLRFHPRSPGTAMEIEDVRLSRASRGEVCAWSDSIVRLIPPVTWQPPAGRAERLPQTFEALARGQRLTVVMLGDSIVMDTANAPWAVLTERVRPRARIDVVAAVRSGTGCWYYREDDRVEQYVLRHHPGLLIIGGISHNCDLDAIRSVVRQARAGDVPEVLLMTDPVGTDGDPRGWPAGLSGDDGPAFAERLANMAAYRSGLRALAAEEQAAFFDIGLAWNEYMAHCGRSYGWFMRDAVHANDRGREVLGRLMLAWFGG
ncbi:MAG: SGNH/GDSL hydrolase family protein [Armatimonadetes bacterium]|nr:SGNH/GDSL hydrolase family protein [Armatimonadota bacterium]